MHQVSVKIAEESEWERLMMEALILTETYIIRSGKTR